MIKPVKFAHVVYRTRRFEEMVRWYLTVFDADIQLKTPALAFLTYDEEHHRFAFANLDVLDPGGRALQHPASATVEHVAYTYASLSDLLATYERLAALGITPYWAIHHGITLSLYYGDPDGNQMEFQIDCFASSAQATDYMYGPDFASNPVGVEFDPAVLAAQLREGVPAHELMRRPPGPISPIRSALNPR